MGLADDAQWARVQARACTQAMQGARHDPDEVARFKRLRAQWNALAAEIEGYLAGDPSVVQTPTAEASDTAELW